MARDEFSYGITVGRRGKVNGIGNGNGEQMGIVVSRPKHSSWGLYGTYTRIRSCFLFQNTGATEA